MYARVITSRKNISLTLGIKASLKFAYRIMSNEKISSIINFTHLSNSKYYLNIKIHLNLKDEDEDLVSINSVVTCNGTKYKSVFFVFTQNDENEAEFFKIEEIVYYKQNLLLLGKYVDIVYCSGLHSYKVGAESINLSMRSLKDYNTPTVHIHYTKEGICKTKTIFLVKKKNFLCYNIFFK